MMIHKDYMFFFPFPRSTHLELVEREQVGSHRILSEHGELPPLTAPRLSAYGVRLRQLCQLRLREHVLHTVARPVQVVLGPHLFSRVHLVIPFGAARPREVRAGEVVLPTPLALRRRGYFCHLQ